MPRPSRSSPSLNTLSLSPVRPVSTSPSTPHRRSQSPFRYVNGSHTMDEKSSLEEMSLSMLPDEKRQSSGSPSVGRSQYNPLSSPTTRLGASCSQEHIPRQTSSFSRGPSQLVIPNQHRPTGQQFYTRPRGLRIFNLFKPWIPLILYAITSFAFLVAIAFWKNEVFAGEFADRVCISDFIC